MTRQHLMTACLGIAFVHCLNVPVHAELKLFGLFRDNAVLQRDCKLPIWGTTTDTKPVTVRFAEQEVTAEPRDGKWRVELAPLKADSNGRALRISQGDANLEVKNVVIGDVWVCGGQSNMYVPLRDTDGAREEIAKSQNDQLRLFFINPFPTDSAHPKEPVDFVDGDWNLCGPKTVDGFTAVGYYFGKNLQRDLKVPIGLIESTLGGTSAERWTNRASMESNPELRDATEGQKYDLYNGLIAPLTRFPIRGVIWYQGESNAPRAWKYRTLLPALIECWRDAWQISDLPFLIVQLPGYEKIEPQPSESDWADMREAQLYVSRAVPHTGLVVTTDLGDEKEIHPRRKREVGERLALVARAKVYGEHIPYSGPLYDKMEIRDGAVVVHFTHVGAGLEAKGGPLTGFTIAGEDHKFHNAEAKIEGKTVVVRSDAVPRPVAVRFGWAKNPQINLWNKDGLPASPFRTDDFPLPTRDNK